MNRPTVSACVITYNQRAYLSQCIEGILSQQGDFSMEIVIADDCSTDGGRLLAEGFAQRDRRIRVLDRGRNLGMGANIKSALAACKGDFIALCEGDDFWTDPKKLDRQLRTFDDRRVMLSTTAGFVTDDAGRELNPVTRIGTQTTLSVGDILAGGSGLWPTCSMIFRRECVERIPSGVYEQGVIDWPLDVFLAAQGCAFYDPTPTCAYRVGARGSWTEQLRNSANFIEHHRRQRQLEEFFRRELGSAYDDEIRRGFSKHVLYFYATLRTPNATKWKELRKDLPRLDVKEKAAAIAFAAIPGLGELAFWLRRRLVAALHG